MGDLNNAAPEMDESHEDTSRSSQSAEEGSLNKAIFSINENMAKMAAVFENICDTKGPPAKKRKARGEDSMSASDPEWEEEAEPSTTPHMDDNVSLYASDELEDDDAVKVLTERNKNPKKVTDPKSSKGRCSIHWLLPVTLRTPPAMIWMRMWQLLSKSDGVRNQILINQDNCWKTQTSGKLP